MIEGTVKEKTLIDPLKSLQIKQRCENLHTHYHSDHITKYYCSIYTVLQVNTKVMFQNSETRSH